VKGKVLFLVNHDIVIYNFRKEIVERLLSEGYEVIISSPYGERIDELVEMGCEFVEVEMDRHGTNLISEFKLLRYYSRMFDEIKPDIILGFTIKPNIYGALAAKKKKIPFVANVTGLGTAVENPGILQKISIGLYKIAFTDIQTVFFQNKENRQFFIDNNIAVDKHKMLPGSGVNLEQFSFLKYPSNTSIDFVFISRIMKDKGIEHYLEAAKYIKSQYSNVNFHICGFSEENYEDTLKQLQEDNIIVYHGMVDDVTEVLQHMDCIVHPSYHEGMSNVLLEAAASGRPIIASDIPGCRETFDEGISGFSFPKKDTQGLIESLEKIIKLDNKERKLMGLAGRKKMEQEFDRQIVINKYNNEIETALEEK